MESSLNRMLIQLERQRYLRESEDDELEEDSNDSSEEFIGFQWSRQQDLFKEKLKKGLENATVDDIYVQQLLLNYFLENGMTEVAQQFAKEAGIELTLQQNNFNNLLQQINTLLEWRKIEEVIKIVETDKKEVFQKNPSLIFNLYCLIFLESEKDQNKDLQIVMGKLLKVIYNVKNNVEKEVLIERLEEVIGSKYTNNTMPAFLKDTTKDLNKGIISLQTSELDKILKLKKFIEQFYNEHFNFVVQENPQNQNRTELVNEQLINQNQHNLYKIYQEVLFLAFFTFLLLTFLSPFPFQTCLLYCFYSLLYLFLISFSFFNKAALSLLNLSISFLKEVIDFSNSFSYFFF